MRCAYLVAALLMLMLGGSNGYYFTQKDSSDVLAEASGAAEDVLRASGSTGYILNIITDGTIHFSSVSKITRNLEYAGYSLFETAPNIVIDFIASNLHMMRTSSKYPHIIIASDKREFLSQILEALFQRDLLAWTTKLLLITRLPIHHLEHVKEVLSRVNGVVLIPSKDGSAKRCDVYFFIPYSQRVLQLAKWTETEGVSYLTPHPMFPEKFQRLIDGGHLKVAAEVFPPHTLPIESDREKEDKNHLFRGPMLIFLDILTSSMNFTYTLRRPPDGAFGYSFPNGTWSGMIGLLVRKEFDFAIGPFNLIYPRAQVVDYTFPLMIDYGRIMARKGEVEINPWGFFMPLGPMVWLGLLLSLIVIMGISRLMKKLLLDPRDTESHQYPVTNYIRILLIQNSEVSSVKHWSNSILIATWMIAMLVVMESYAGNLRSLLIVRYVPQPYHSVRAVVDDPSVTVLWEQDSAYKQLLYMTTFGVFKELADAGTQGKITFLTTPEFYGAVDNKIIEGDHVLLVEDMTLKILLAYHFSKSGSCMFYLSRERFFPFLLVMTAQKYSPFVPAFNKRIVGITESGIYGNWLKEEFRHSISCLSQPTKILFSSNLALSNLWGIFAVSGCGYLASLLMFGVELLSIYSTKES